MATEITMPQLSDTMFDGTILSWLKKEGDSVEVGDAVAEVATEKADLEIESFHEGTLLKILAPEGAKVDVGSIIAVVGEPGEDVSGFEAKGAFSGAAKNLSGNSGDNAASTAKEISPSNGAVQTSNQSSEDGGRIKASPLARSIASSNNFDLSSITGSGEGGRITKKDVEAALGGVKAGSTQQSVTPPVIAAATPSKPAVSAPAPLPGSEKIEPLSSMRQAIAAKMVQSVTDIPHFYLTSKIKVDSMLETRANLKALPAYEGITINHLIIRASALALKKYPRINSCYRDGSLVTPSDVNIGIVTALPDGLLIPVVKNVFDLPLLDLVSESRALVQRARSGRPKADDLMGATFCISNVGRFAIESFTAVINPGTGAILAVGAIEAEPVVTEGGVIEPASVMRVTLSVDHRIIDGVMGAEFLTELKNLIENPVLLLA